MPGSNSTGAPNTNDYNLGRGIVYFAALTNGIPGPYRDLGNAPEFSISVEVEKLEHQSSRAGLRIVDKEVVISQKMGLSLTIDELNFENLALFFSGSRTAGITNPANAAAQAQAEMIASVVLGQWYDILDPDGSGDYSSKRAYGFVSGHALTFKNGTAPGTTVLVAGTDYEVDLDLGRVRFLPTAVNITAGEPVDVQWSSNAAGPVDEVKALTSSATTGALKFVSINPAAGDHKTEYQFHQVALSAEGDFSLIGDEFTTMQLTGAAEANPTADADSSTLTIRTLRA